MINGVRQLFCGPLVMVMLILGSTAEAQHTQSETNPSAEQEKAATPSKPMRVRVSQGSAAGLVKKRVAPHYPEEARAQRIQGMVTLKVWISTAGDVIDATLISGHPALAQAAIGAVKKWKYKPFLLNGQPMEIETEVVVNFTLVGS